MRFATSYFNGILYRKTMARFWPLWAGYSLIWLFLMPLDLLNSYLPHSRSSWWNGDFDEVGWRLGEALQFPSYVTPGMYLAAFFAILCAMAVFGYLYNSRSSCWFHALPMRREALFTTQYLAGLSFLLLPQLVTALLTALVEMAFLPVSLWGQALGALLAWLVALSGICLFFFSFAAFCAMFTGHILALPAFYVILNVLADVIYTLIDALFQEFFFGYAGNPGVARVVEYLFPISILREASMFWGRDEDRYFQSAPTIAAYAVVGILLAVAALCVYRYRHAETAGDVVSIPLVRPLFRYGVSFCAGLCLGMFTAAFFDWNSVSALIPCVLVWTVIGYFVAEMLLRKSFRVLKAWKGAAAMTAVMFLLCLGCTMDLFGVEARMPRLDQVADLTVRMNMGYPNDSGDQLSVTLTDPEDIQKFLNLHQVIVNNRKHLDSDFNSKWFSTGHDYTYLRLQYDLKGSSSLNRVYGSIPLNYEELDIEGSLTSLCQQIYADRELVAQAYDFEGFLKDSRMTGAWLGYLNDADGNRAYEEVYVDDYAKELWDAVQQDFAEGNIGVRYLFDDGSERQANTYHTDLHFEAVQNSSEVYGPAANAEVYYETETRFYTNSLTITLTPQARHTLAVLDKTGIYEDGYSLAERELDYNPRYPDTVIY